MLRERVKYFEANDLLYGYNLNKIETMEIPEFSSIDINDAIEFYEIKRYFDKGVRSTDWSDTQYQEYIQKVNTLSSLAMRFFNTLNDDSILNHYAVVDIQYCSEFWHLFDICKLYERITSEVFGRLIHSEHTAPFDLYKYKNIVGQYGEALRNYILENEFCITIVLHVFEQDYTGKEKLYLPSEFTGDDICAYLDGYIDSDNPNPNHLDVIHQMQHTKQFPISDELRLKAKRRYGDEMKKVFETGSSLEYVIQLSFSPEQIDEKKAEHVGNELHISYSTQWLLDTLDYPSILNNFIYIFEYVDVPQMRSQHVSKTADAGVFERIFAFDSSRVYPCNTGFNFINSLAAIQMNAYYRFLSEQSIRLEEVLEWCFVEYIQKEFSCPEMRVLFPSESTSYAEKCSTVIATFEAILKQFSLYIKNGSIDFELIGMSTTPTKIGSVLSLVPQKYIYGTGKNFEQLTFMMFSDQCMYSYVERIHKQNQSYSCFLDLLKNEQVFLSDYREREYAAFNYLAEFGLINIASDGRLLIKDTTKVAILKDLYQNSVVSKWRYPPASYVVMQQLLAKGIIVEKSTLFSEPEVKYLNYLLNRLEYSNGLEIRNKYAHGIQQVITDDNEHMQNYFILLKVFILLAIKINDEFELREILQERGIQL
jgi:hypothetical protein